MTLNNWHLDDTYTAEELLAKCNNLKKLDHDYGTGTDSPLHHDSGRCPRCNPRPSVKDFDND